MNNLWVMYCGFANILDGLLRIFSLGFWVSPGFGQMATLKYAKHTMKGSKT